MDLINSFLVLVSFFFQREKNYIVSLCLPAKELELAFHWSTWLSDWHPSATEKELRIVAYFQSIRHKHAIWQSENECFKIFARSTESIFFKTYLENCFKCSWSVKNKQLISFQICSTIFEVKPNHECKNSLRIKNIELRGWPDLFTIWRIFRQICYLRERGLEGYYFPRLSTSMLVPQCLQRCILIASVHHQHVSICLYIWSTNDVSKLVD